MHGADRGFGSVRMVVREWSHYERLQRAWTRLRGWVDEARDDLRTRDALAASAAEWDGAGRDESFLLHGARLESVRQRFTGG